MGSRKPILLTLACAGIGALFFGLVEAQAPGRGAALHQTRSVSNTVPAAQVKGNLAQVMRGNLFPNSNVIFLRKAKPG